MLVWKPIIYLPLNTPLKRCLTLIFFVPQASDSDQLVLLHRPQRIRLLLEVDEEVSHDLMIYRLVTRN